MRPCFLCSRTPRLIILASVIVFAAVGCNAASKALGTKDPVATYKSKVRDEVATLKARVAKVQVNDEYKVNVVKSDSLISPYIGTAELIVQHPITMTSDGEQHTGTVRFQVDLAHGLQDGEWKLTSCKHTFLPAGPGEDPYLADIFRRVAGNSKEDGSIDGLALAIISECTPSE